jgi:hypothetical protein
VTPPRAATSLACALVCGVAVADDAPIAVAPLPLAAKRVPASAEECAVWRREQSFASTVERHDARAFAEHLHAGTIFDAGRAEADRGRDAVAASWAPIVVGTAIALRWRPGIVQIGGEPGIAISRGPFILQRKQGGADVVRVGFYQTVWLRDARDGVWRVLYDGSASTAQAMDSRAAAERWVEEQPMSDCAQ